MICANCETNETDDANKVCVTCHEKEGINLVEAWEMNKNQLYLTYHTRTRFYVELVVLNPGKNQARVKAYFPNHAEWREVVVPYEYRLKTLTQEEQTAALEKISKSTHDTREKFSKMGSRTKKEAGTGRSRGVLSGLGMLEAWGKYFRENAHQPGAREKVREAMKKDFPNKHLSVERWLDAYRTYYNKGRLPNTPKPEVEITNAEWMEKTSDVQA